MARNTFHVALYVADLDRAIARYEAILDRKPAKVAPGYAKFEIDDPPVILSLNVGGEPGKLSHLGVRLPATGEVASELARQRAAGVEALTETGVTCCYAKSDKFWVRDADGVSWEIYTVLEDVPVTTAAEPALREFLDQGNAR